jgi:protein involved in polysaccharide export with SLBB domain
MRRSLYSAAFALCAAAVVLLTAHCPQLASAAGGPATQPIVDVIVANDLLCIGIWDNRPTGGETLKTVRVDGNGYVSLFYIGQLKLAGLTFEQAERSIADTYRANGALENCAPSLNRLEPAHAATVRSANISAGDRISVRILDLVPDVEQSRIFTVSDGGKVGLPLLGQFKVEGMTEANAEVAITRAFEQQFNLRNIPVSVLRLGARQNSEPTVAAEPGIHPNQSPQQRR